MILNFWCNMWRVYFVVVFIKSVEPINHPVYKIALTQKGFPQYLQYDIDTPPIREFTLCVWVRVFEFSDEQTIFTYAVHGNDQIMRLWIEEEGKLVKLSIKDESLSSTAVDLARDTWHHVCLSYQSDFGAWALYFNGRLASCEATKSIFGYKLPAGGHFIFGYGSSQNGSPNGLEGELYGVNILLISVIDKNDTSNQYNNNAQQRHKISKTQLNGRNSEVKKILENQIALQTMKNVDTAHQINNFPRNFIKFYTPYSQFEHDIGVDLGSKMLLKNNTVHNLILPKNPNNSTITNFWEVLSRNKQYEQFGSHTKKLPLISEYETPPPLPLKLTQENSFPLNVIKEDPSKFMFGGKGPNELVLSQNSVRDNAFQSIIPDIETPPPVEKKKEVYGQWTTSSFAKDVLNYLKSINGARSSQRNIPKTIPLPKVSDHYPYPSDLIPSQILAPEEIRKTYYFQHQIKKRENRHPQINIEILENDLRSFILQEHAKTNPQHVEITNRGKNKMDKDYRLQRKIKINYSAEEISASNKNKLKSQTNSPKQNSEKEIFYQDFYKDLVNTLPYLKSSKLLIPNDIHKNKMIQKNEMYMKSLSDESKWHNIHSNIFSPRDTDSFEETNQFIDSSILNLPNKISNFKELKQSPIQNKYIKNYSNTTVDEGFIYRREISNLSSPFNATISLHNENSLFSDQAAKAVNALKFINKFENINKFNQHVKIGNALNERDIIGNSGEKNKQSFVGGNENIPDIHRYRSDIDLTKDHVPPSLMPKVCRRVEKINRLFNLNFHVSSDLQESKNYGVEFIITNYKCLEQDNIISKKHFSSLVLWSETPVRLFGGAYPKKAVKQCGLF